MKIAWFTPFDCKSAIGKIGRLVCQELSKDHQVEIWTPHKEHQIPTKLPVVCFDQTLAPEALSKYDCIIYNFGNYAGFHREIVEVALRIPGIVILHDQTMASFWGQYFSMPEFGGDPQTGRTSYRALLEKYYGAAAGVALDTAWESGHYPVYDHPALNGYTLLEAALAGAKGVFTHSKFFARRLQTRCNLPVEFSYLPCEVPHHTPHHPEMDSLLAKARAQGRKILVSTGIVHPIKRIDKVAEVLRQSPELAEKICYVVIGGNGGSYGERLCALADGELCGCLYMLGYQPEEAMEAALAGADMSVNLRYPNSEVCSLSLWEQMAWGKPVLVLDRGIYGEVPAQCVERLSLAEETAGIHRTLKKLVENKLFAEKGALAKEFIARECSVAAYCRKLLDFAATVVLRADVARLQNQVLDHSAEKMKALGLAECTATASFAAITDQLAKVLGGEEAQDTCKHTLGIWIGFPYHVPSLNREGISRLMGYLVSSMLRYHPDVEIEAWCYACNAEETEIICASVADTDRSRLKIITEANWVAQLEASPAQQAQVGEITLQQDNLVCAARIASNASVFIPLILYLDRVSETEKQLFVPGYDMAVAGHYNEFLEKDSLYAARNSDYIWRAENLAARGGKFFCNSDTVRRGEILKYIRNLKEENTQVVYLPPNIPMDIKKTLLPEVELRKRFSLEGSYLFYPTQIRPYKNVTTLVHAFHLLALEYPELILVLTGEPKDVSEVDQLLTQYNLYPRVRLLKNVSEIELYSLYRYAAAIPVASYFEGGFHYQTLEALLTEAPAIVADIPVVRERIASIGFSTESSGLLLFNPMDVEELVNQLRVALRDREGTSRRQRAFGKTLLSYTWKEASQCYYDLFFSQQEIHVNQG